MYPITRHRIDMVLNFHIQLFQLSMGLLFNFPHLSFPNFDYAQWSGSSFTTHSASSRLYLLSSSIALSYSTIVGTYTTHMNISVTSSFDAFCLIPNFLASPTKFSVKCPTQYASFSFPNTYGTTASKPWFLSDITTGFSPPSTCAIQSTTMANPHWSPLPQLHKWHQTDGCPHITQPQQAWFLHTGHWDKCCQ